MNVESPMTLSELERLAGEATPGPWLNRPDEKLGWPRVCGPVKKNGKREILFLAPAMQDETIKTANANYIAACSPDRISALVKAAKAASYFVFCADRDRWPEHGAITELRAALQSLREAGVEP